MIHEVNDIRWTTLGASILMNERETGSVPIYPTTCRELFGIFTYLLVSWLNRIRFPFSKRTPGGFAAVSGYSSSTRLDSFFHV